MLASLLATVLASLQLTPSAQARADATTCGADQVTVVVDFNELGGDTQVACADDGGSASQVFDAAGFPLTYARAPGMQGFVCTIDGLPADEQCTDGTAYWSLWWTDASADPAADGWAYATLGADQLPIEPGDRLGFAWHQGDGDAVPPDASIDDAGTGGGGTESPDPARPADPDPDVDPDADPDADSGGVPTWALVGLGVVVLGAAAAVPLLRRRS